MVDKREITPELLARLTCLLFTKVPFEDVLEGKIQFNDIPCDHVANLMMNDDYFRQSYSKIECQSYAQSVIDYVAQKTAWQNGCSSDRCVGLNAFNLLLLTLQDLLVVNNNRIECSYEQIFSWRLLSSYLGEELALSSMYAAWDYRHGKTARWEFDWPFVTAHNNKQLNMILRRGISDHHCHLWGSTPYFHVSWVNLMNRLTNNIYINNFQRLIPNDWSDSESRTWHMLAPERNPTEETHVDGTNMGEGPINQLLAAWIRLYLCERISNTGSEALECIPLENVLHSVNWRNLALCRDKLQTALEVYANDPNMRHDYALNMFAWKLKKESQNYEILIGERWLYYSVFMDYRKPRRQRRLSNHDYNLFFAYFLIRTKIRSKMVQNNNRMGFDNFQEIQRRKSLFLGDPISERYLVCLAINETIKKDYVEELEFRITPDVEQVRRLERIVSEVEGEEIKRRYYYVFHFIKQSEALYNGAKGAEGRANTQRPFSRMVCRQHDFRNKLMRQANDIIRFRNSEPHLARRVRGIDAASQEIGCRPEVFATVYRLLGEHTVDYGGYTEEYQPLPELGKTYHVGEDFLDIVDGLRAIDEVVHFLSFDCGDRLGHAIVLGTNVEEWYEKKHRVISLAAQDYLDNLSWLYHALNHFVVPEVHTLKERIAADFEYWFRIVYRNNITDEEMNGIMDRARDCYDKTHEDHDLYHKHTCHFDITDYYRAWTLRGDDPSCYAAGYFRKPGANAFLIPTEQCKVNEHFPAHYEDRYVAEYSLLNYYYQYDEKVRQEGRRRIKVDISDEYIRAVKAVQIEMRFRLARRGISIETNPTSNVMISTFRKYEKHPLLAFYNRGLPVNEQEEEECAQLQVSINTDDSGVFYTDLETEYALLARSVEQIVEKNERPRFKKTDIYEWIDNIRVMGREQSFRILEPDPN